MAQVEHTCVNAFVRLKAAHTMHCVADTGTIGNDLNDDKDDRSDDFELEWGMSSRISGRFR